MGTHASAKRRRHEKVLVDVPAEAVEGTPRGTEVHPAQVCAKSIDKLISVVVCRLGSNVTR